MEFKADDIKLTPEDIAACSDYEQVMKWKYLIDGKITETDNRLGYLEAKEIDSPGFIDETRLLKLKSYRRVLGFLSQCLQGRAGLLRKKERKGKSASVDRHFVNVAKEYLKPETFSLVLEIAMTRASMELNATSVDEIHPETTEP